MAPLDPLHLASLTMCLKLQSFFPALLFIIKFSILMPKARCVLEFRTFCILEDYMMYPMYYTLASVGFGASHY